MNRDDERPVAALAIDARGELVVTCEGPRVLAWTAASAEPIWEYDFTSSDDPAERSVAGVFRRPAGSEQPIVVGVRWAGARALAVDDRGRLIGLSRRGAVMSTLTCKVAAFALLATEAGMWAVLHEDGAVIGRGGRELRRLSIDDVRCGTFADAGNFLALGTGDGRMIVTPTGLGAAREVEVGGPPRGLAWVGRYGWLVARDDVIVRVDPSYAGRETIWTSELPLAGIVGADERICGVRRGRHELLLLDQLARERIASVALAPFVVGEIDLRAWPQLVAAIDGGGHVRVDVVSDPKEPQVRVWRGPRAAVGELAPALRPRVVADEVALARERARAIVPRPRSRIRGLLLLVLVVLVVTLSVC